MIKILGIDPGLRHTGACLLTEAGFSLFQIDSAQTDWVSASNNLRLKFRSLLAMEKPDVICMERQLSVGAQSSALLYHVQMVLLGVIAEDRPNIPIAMPLPGQLRSYVQKRLGAKPASDSALVQTFKEATNTQGRVSIHKVDAYYLCKAGLEVFAGTWYYKKPSNEKEPLPWSTTNGRTGNPD